MFNPNVNPTATGQTYGVTNTAVNTSNGKPFPRTTSRRPSNKPTEAQIQQTLKDNPTVAETIKIERLQGRLNDFCEQAVKRVKAAKTEAEFEEIHQALLRALKSACELM